MARLILIISGVLETVWAAALEQTARFTRPWPTLVFVVALLLSMAGLGHALHSIPLGTAYAVWVGIGAIGTAAYGMLFLGDPVTVARLICLTLIVAAWWG